MNKDEYGNFIRVNLNEDISGNVNSLTLISPSPTVTIKTILAADGLLVGSVPLVVGEETYNANEYVEYKTLKGDIFISGDWNTRVLSVNDSEAKCRITDKDLVFTVDP